MAQRGRGHPSLYTEERIERILEALRMGATYTLACNYAGVSYRRFREWMVDAEEVEGSQYAGLPEMVAEAEGIAAVGWLAKIEKAATEGVWQAAAWKLERRYPRDYSLTRRDEQQRNDLGAEAASSDAVARRMGETYGIPESEPPEG